MKAPDGWEFVPGQGEEVFTRPHGVIEIRRLSFLTRISAWFAPESTPETAGGASPNNGAPSATRFFDL